VEQAAEEADGKPRRSRVIAAIAVIARDRKGSAPRRRGDAERPDKSKTIPRMIAD